MRIIYEVNLEVLAPATAAFSTWLPGHVAEVLALPGFETATIERPERPAKSSGTQAWCVRYQLVDREALDRYLATDAARMRQAALTRFGSSIQADRRILRLEQRLDNGPD